MDRSSCSLVVYAALSAVSFVVSVALTRAGQGRTDYTSSPHH